MNSHALTVCFASCAVMLLAACANDGGPAHSFDQPLASRAESADDWVFVFGDEFDAPAADPSKWTAFDGDPRHPNTINTTSPSMVSVSGGSMFVTAVKTPDDKAFPYTTGYIDTRAQFAQTYGKIEFRARCAYAPGVWFALWGRSWRGLVPELDIEFLAENINQAWFVNHWDVPPVPADLRRGFTTVDGMDITEFHTYAITWRPDLVEWAIDGKAYRRITDREHIPREPMYWIMNAWVGGWGGIPSEATIFPAKMEVDHIRIYRLREWATDPSIRIDDPRPKYSVKGAIDVELADFDKGARVEVWDGESLVETMTTPPFRFHPANLRRAAHKLTFKGTDGVREATTSLAVTIY